MTQLPKYTVAYMNYPPKRQLVHSNTHMCLQSHNCDESHNCFLSWKHEHCQLAPIANLENDGRRNGVLCRINI